MPISDDLASIACRTVARSLPNVASLTGNRPAQLETINFSTAGVFGLAEMETVAFKAKFVHFGRVCNRLELRSWVFWVVSGVDGDFDHGDTAGGCCSCSGDMAEHFFRCHHVLGWVGHLESKNFFLLMRFSCKCIMFQYRAAFSSCLLGCMFDVIGALWR